MFNLGWVRLCWPHSPVTAGSNVAILIWHLGFWSLNPARIVYVLNEDVPLKRFGFAYGTLIGHAESGEERFTVEWNRKTDEVYYDLLAFSRPSLLAAKLGYPLARHLQRKFARDSLNSMRRATAA